MIRTWPGLLGLLLLAAPARAEGVAGEFDYWVLALSWSPTWCALEGGPGEPQCDRGMDWVLHGLWPQYEEGYPRDCATDARDPSRAETALMSDVMGSGGLAWHEWRAHGTCSGLDPEDYFALSREALARAPVPEVFARLPGSVDIAPGVVEQAFLREGGGDWEADGVTVICDAGRIGEVRLCLTRDLEPRACGADVVRDCSLPSARLDPP